MNKQFGFKRKKGMENVLVQHKGTILWKKDPRDQFCSINH